MSTAGFTRTKRGRFIPAAAPSAGGLPKSESGQGEQIKGFLKRFEKKFQLQVSRFNLFLPDT
jgi:hypothetical protein